MLSISLAKKLKEAGFKMPVGKNALYQTVTDGNVVGVIIDINFGNGDKKVQYVEEVNQSDWRLKEKWFKHDLLIWVPSLSDLLDWLEKKGFCPILKIWDYHGDGTTIYECQLEEKKTFNIVFSEEIIADFENGYPDDSHPVLAFTKENAVAKAVLWVLNNKEG